MVMQGIMKNSNIETQIEIVTAEDATKMPINEGAVNHLSYDYIPLMGIVMDLLILMFIFPYDVTWTWIFFYQLKPWLII